MECWCGNRELLPYSPDYMLCDHCKTLVLRETVPVDFYNVNEDDKEFYGKSYWFEHQENDLEYGNILSRARTDIPERIIYWLQTFLKYKVNPGKTLEIGCSHGGFVSLLQMSGFDATGLELSPWVVNFAKQTFQIPILLGKIEEHSIAPGTVDAIILMDVLEHLPDPLNTITYCLKLLKKDGILVIQTPKFQDSKSYQALIEENNPFLQMLQPREHIFLFSENSIKEFFNKLNIHYLSFEGAYFSHTDMYLIASQRPLKLNSTEEIEQSLMSTPSGRFVLAMLDMLKKDQVDKVHLDECEEDRAARLNVILNQADQIGKLEADRAARLDVIERQGDQLGKLESERNDLQNELKDIKQHIETIEADRAARLNVIEKQGDQLGKLIAERNDLQNQLLDIKQQFKAIEADRAARLNVIKKQANQVSRLQNELQDIQNRLINIKYLKKLMDKLTKK